MSNPRGSVPPGQPSALVQRIPIRQFLRFLLLLLVAIALRTWRLDTIPPGFHFDESFEGLEAWRILTDASYRPLFLTGNFGVPPLNAYANALVFGLWQVLDFPLGPLAMRTTAAIFGLAGVLTVYGAATEMRRLVPVLSLSPLFPFFAAMSLAVMRWHIHFSRMGIEPIIVPVIWAGAIWLLLRGWRLHSWTSYAGGGIMLAAGMYSYQAAWIIPMLLALTALHLLLPFLNNRQRWVELSVMGFTALLLVLPLFAFFWQNPDLVFLRPTQLSIVGQTTSPADTTVWRNLQATVTMFSPIGQVGDLDPRRNLPGAPALNLWQLLPFALGLVVALRRPWRVGYAIPLLGLVGLALPSIFSEYAPHFHRIVGATAPTALLCGMGLDLIWRWRPGKMALMRWLSPLLLLLALATSGWTYFQQWAARPELFHAFDVGLWRTGQWMAEQPPTTDIFITPRGLEHPTLAFALQTRTHRPPPVTSFDGRAIFPLVDGVSSNPAYYVAIEHEDFRTRLLLPDVFPTASVVWQVADFQNNIYAQVYARPAQTKSARSPFVSFSADFGDGIGLVGYDVQPIELIAGQILYLQLHWRVTDVPTADWTVFAHLVTLDANQTVAGHDSIPGAGSLPTLRWQSNWRILDEYQLPLPADLPPGEYALRIGLYTPDGRRMPADGPGLLLGTVPIATEASVPSE